MAPRKKTDFEKLGGWVPDPHGVEDVMNSPEVKHPVFSVGAADVLAGYDKRDTHLWQYLLRCFPDYQRGAQAIGSCVAWGAELVETILCCKHWVQMGQSPIAQVATEPNYGLCRVEGLNKTFGGWSDGAYGGAMAKAALNFGCVLRLDHSQETRNKSHNLTRYSGQKEKQWGAYGCGGKDDRGLLDAIAKRHPVKAVSQVSSFEDVAAAICGSHCPVTIASTYGTSMRRDKYGECRWTGTWHHQMCVIAVRFGRRPAALIAQSWGSRSASGPSGDEYTEHLPEGGTPDNILGFCWWSPAEDMDKICRSGDCWAFSDVDGWRIDPLSLALSWKHRKHTFGWS